MVFDNTPPNGTPGVLMGFLEGRDARVLGAGTRGRAPPGGDVAPSPAVRRARGEPAGYADKDWTAEPYSRGCYAGVPTPGTWTAYGRALREPIGRIHWAGTETATRWMGYFDGAIQAGKRAAGEVLAAEGAGAAPEAERVTA